jgi:hypothetical protein
MPTLAFDDNLRSEYYVISDNEDSTQFWIYMSDPSISTYIRPPYVLTDHEVLYPAISGTAARGGWLDR